MPAIRERPAADASEQAEIWDAVSRASELYDRYVELTDLAYVAALEDEPEPAVPTMDTPLGIDLASDGGDGALLE
jgi:hypothetical protein